MKKLTISLVILLATVVTFAQTESSKFGLYGGFGGPMVFTNFNQQPSVAIGGGGAMLVTKHLFMGGYGQGTTAVSPIYSKLANYTHYRIESEMGGLWVGYIFRTSKYHFTLSGKSAWGQLSLIDTEAKTTYFDNIRVISPTVEMERKLGVLSVAVGVYYNIYRGVELLTYTSNDFSSPGVSFGLKFGMF